MEARFLREAPIVDYPDHIFLEDSVVEGIYSALDFARVRVDELAGEMSEAVEFADKIITK